MHKRRSASVCLLRAGAIPGHPPAHPARRGENRAVALDGSARQQGLDRALHATQIKNAGIEVRQLRLGNRPDLLGRHRARIRCNEKLANLREREAKLLRATDEAQALHHRGGKFPVAFRRPRGLLQPLRAERRQLTEYAGRLPGIDLPRFTAALTSGAHADEIQADETADQALGFPGTPSLRIGSTRLNGAQPYDRIREAIDTEPAR